MSTKLVRSTGLSSNPRLESPHTFPVVPPPKVGCPDGPLLGSADGWLVGMVDGALLGTADGWLVGLVDGPLLGSADGWLVGLVDGPLLGTADGWLVDLVDGPLRVGLALGSALSSCFIS